jgi:hypothetical protein
MAVAVLVAVIIVIAGALILTSKPSSSSPNPLPTLTLGPKVVIVPVAGTGSRLLPLSNNTTITIQLFASVPSAFETPGTSLTSSVLDANYTAGSIVNSNSTAGLQVTTEQVSIWAAWAIQHFLGADSNGSFTLSTSGPDSSYSASTIWARTTGYLNATNAYGAAASALGAFSTALGLGLALVDATAATHGVDFDASEPAVVAETAELITDAIGMSAQILAQFNSISAWTGTNTVTFTYGLFNDPAPHLGGSNYTVRFFESQEPVSFILPGGNACSSYAPVNFMNATAIV